jgi:hypothetical protein
MARRALQRAGSGRPDLHVVAADEGFEAPEVAPSAAILRRLAAEPHRAAGNLTGSTMDRR